MIVKQPQIIKNLAILSSRLLASTFSSFVIISTTSQETHLLHLPFLKRVLSNKFVTFFSDSTFISFAIHFPLFLILLSFVSPFLAVSHINFYFLFSFFAVLFSLSVSLSLFRIQKFVLTLLFPSNKKTN